MNNKSNGKEVEITAIKPKKMKIYSHTPMHTGMSHPCMIMRLIIYPGTHDLII